MSRLNLRKRVAVCATAMAMAATGSLVAASNAFGAASTTGMTITAIAPKKIAALTANQVVTITGTNFDESIITGVELGPCNAVYVVANPTTIYAKTPNATCGTATASTTTPETITITDNETNTVTFTGTATTGLFYVTPPAIAATNPAYTDLSSAIPAKVKQLKVGGGQLVRINAAADYTFAAGVTAALGGTAMTGVTVVGSTAGNYITAVAPAKAAGAVALTLTANGVSKTFPATATGLSYWAPPTVATVAPNAGRAVVSGGTGGDTVITGTGFSPTTNGNTVTICGQTATVKATPAPTATSLSVTVPDPQLGTDVYEGVCPVRVTVGGNASPVTATSTYSYLTQ